MPANMTAMPQTDQRKERVALSWLEELEREQAASDRFLDAQLRLRALRIAEIAVTVHQELSDYAI